MNTYWVWMKQSLVYTSFWNTKLLSCFCPPSFIDLFSERKRPVYYNSLRMKVELTESCSILLTSCYSEGAVPSHLPRCCVFFPLCESSLGRTKAIQIQHYLNIMTPLYTAAMVANLNILGGNVGPRPVCTILWCQRASNCKWRYAYE